MLHSAQKIKMTGKLEWMKQVNEISHELRVGWVGGGGGGWGVCVCVCVGGAVLYIATLAEYEYH